jgi:hypothetical protein
MKLIITTVKREAKHQVSGDRKEGRRQYKIGSCEISVIKLEMRAHERYVLGLHSLRVAMEKQWVAERNATISRILCIEQNIRN